jgi:hypothetical protein
MKSILDRVARSAARTQYSGFRPATTQEFFALRLAARLGESASARHYAELAEQYSEGQLLAAYRWALASHLDPARRFHLELEPLKGRDPGSSGGGRLAAIRIERRAVGVAILTGDHLKHADARQLSSSQDKALGSAVGFVTRLLEKFRCESAALEIIPYGHEVQRTLVHKSVLRVLHPQAIGIVEVSKADLLAAFAYPAPRFRGEVRKIISTIYPVLDQQFGGPWTHDAAALGLYVQTERLFNTINHPLL